MIENKTILNHTIDRLLSHNKINKVVLAISKNDEYFKTTELCKNPNIIHVHGGKERVDSVLNGLQVIDDNNWVLVHDAARPCITHEDIDSLIDQCIYHKSGGILAAPVVDTIKCANNSSAGKINNIRTTIDRDSLWHAFTPQMFQTKELKKAIKQALVQGINITDEASAIETLGLPCLLVSGRRDNIKITRPEDLLLAEFYLKNQKTEQLKG